MLVSDPVNSAKESCNKYPGSEVIFNGSRSRGRIEERGYEWELEKWDLGKKVLSQLGTRAVVCRDLQAFVR